jgi:hypothetical protein
LATAIEQSTRIADTQRDRWYAALTKAVGQLMDGIQVERHGDEMTFPSRTRSGISHHVDGHCTCEAGEKGDPCWHRAARQLILLLEDAQKDDILPPPHPPQRRSLNGRTPPTPLSTAERERAIREMDECYPPQG